MRKINFSRVKILCFLLTASIICSCSAGKKQEFIKSLPGGNSEEQEIAALSHFSYAQLLAQSGQPDQAVEELKKALAADPGSVHLHQALAFMLYQQGNLKESLAVTDRALKLAPQSPFLHHLRGLILTDGQKYKEGEKEFRQAMALNPDGSEHVIGLADNYLRQKRPQDALKVLQEFCRTHPQDLDANFFLAVMLQALGKTDESDDVFAHMLEVMPDFYPALRGRFTLWYEAGEWGRAALIGNELLRTYPDDTETRLLVAQALVRLDRDEEAIIVLEEGKKIDPNNSGLWVQEGYLYLDQNRPEMAREQFLGAIEIEPKDRAAAYGLGLAALRLKDMAEAKTRFESVTTDSPFFLDARMMLAFIALQDGDVDGAMNLVQPLYDHHPSDPDVVLTYARIGREAGKYDLAEAAVRQAITTMPRLEELQYELALILSARGEEEKARQVAEQVLKKNPRTPWALNFIGYSLAVEGKELDRAEKLIRQALELEPDAGYILDSLGWVYYQRGDYETALQYLEQADRANGPDAEILEHTGDCLLKLGRKAEAKDAYTRGLDALPNPAMRVRLENKLKELP